MKKNFYLIPGILMVIIVISAYVMGPPTGVTNAPGESGCATNASCHIDTFTAHPGFGMITVMNGIPPNGYIPDSVYTMMPYTMNTGDSIIGFQTVALLSNGDNGGTVSITDPVRTQLLTTASPYHEYVTQTQAGSVNPLMHDWMYHWQAPSSGSGTVTFYVAFVSSNNDNGSSGDKVYVDSLVFMENTTSTSDILSHGDLSISLIYPMPAYNYIAIGFQGSNSTDLQISLHDISGRTVIQGREFSMEPPGGSYRLELEGIAPGIYFIEVRHETSASLVRMIIKA